MIRMRVSVTHDNFNHAIKLTKSQSDRVVRETAKLVERQARMTAPVLHGILKNSHGSEKKNNGDWEVYAAAKYALYVHEGMGSNRYKGPRPWLFQALEWARLRVPAIARRISGSP